jgi:hypothetical protein
MVDWDVARVLIRGGRGRGGPVTRPARRVSTPWTSKAVDHRPPTLNGETDAGRPTGVVRRTGGRQAILPAAGGGGPPAGSLRGNVGVELRRCLPRRSRGPDRPDRVCPSDTDTARLLPPEVESDATWRTCPDSPAGRLGPGAGSNGVGRTRRRDGRAIASQVVAPRCGQTSN